MGEGQPPSLSTNVYDLGENLKIILRFILGFTALVFISLIALGVMLYTADPTQYKLTLVKEFNQRTGLYLEVRGGMTFTFRPQPKILLSGVTLMASEKNPDFSLKAKQLEVDFTWKHLFTQNIHQYGFILKDGTFKVGLNQNNKSGYHFKKFKGTFHLENVDYLFKDFWYETVDGTYSGTLNLHLDSTWQIRGQLSASKWNLMNDQQDDLSGIDILSDADVNVDLTIGEMIVKKFHFRDVKTKFNLKNGILTLKPIRFRLNQGNFEAQIISERERPYKTILTLKGERLRLSDLVNVPPQSLEGGMIKLNITGEGRGETIQGMLPSFNGRALFEMGPLIIKNTKKFRTSEGFLFSLFRFASAKAKDVKLECAVAKADIRHGIAYLNPGIGIQTQEANILGNGQIDLAKEEIALELGLDHKSPLSLQVGSFDNYLKVTGPIDNPKYKISSANVVTEGGSILAAVVTGGLSLIAQKMLQETSKITDPCGMVLRSKTSTDKSSDQRRK